MRRSEHPNRASFLYPHQFAVIYGGRVGYRGLGPSRTSRVTNRRSLVFVTPNQILMYIKITGRFPSLVLNFIARVCEFNVFISEKVTNLGLPLIFLKYSMYAFVKFNYRSENVGILNMQSGRFFKKKKILVLVKSYERKIFIQRLKLRSK